MGTRVHVRAGSYRHAETIVGRHDPAVTLLNDEGGLVVDADATGDVGVSVEGRCSHCRQQYLFHALPPEGIVCACCDEISFGALDCVRCGRFVRLTPTDG